MTVSHVAQSSASAWAASDGLQCTKDIARRNSAAPPATVRGARVARSAAALRAASVPIDAAAAGSSAGSPAAAAVSASNSCLRTGAAVGASSDVGGLAACRCRRPVRHASTQPYQRITIPYQNSNRCHSGRHQPLLGDNAVSSRGGGGGSHRTRSVTITGRGAAD